MLKAVITSSVTNLLYIYQISFSFGNLTDGVRKITGKWSDTSDTSVLKTVNLKVLSTKVFVRLWPIGANILHLTLAGFVYG